MKIVFQYVLVPYTRTLKSRDSKCTFLLICGYSVMWTFGHFSKWQLNQLWSAVVKIQLNTISMGKIQLGSCYCLSLTAESPFTVKSVNNAETGQRIFAFMTQFWLAFVTDTVSFNMVKLKSIVIWSVGVQLLNPVNTNLYSENILRCCSPVWATMCVHPLHTWMTFSSPKSDRFTAVGETRKGSVVVSWPCLLLPHRNNSPSSAHTTGNQQCEAGGIFHLKIGG